MGLISPRTLHPATINAGASRMDVAGVGYVDPGLWTVAFPQVIGAGLVLTFPDEVNVCGYNSFMLVFSATGVAPTFDLNILLRDPYAPSTTIAVRSAGAAIAGGSNLVRTWGAFSLDAPTTVGDVWDVFTIEIENVGVNALTIATPRLFCGVR